MNSAANPPAYYWEQFCLWAK